MIVQIVIDDPGATDPDESTVGLVVKGTTVPKVHLQDGLWYAFIAEEDTFGLLLDVVTDGLVDGFIAVNAQGVAALSDIAGGAAVTIGLNTFTNSVPGVGRPVVDPLCAACADSFVEEITQIGGITFIEVSRADLFPTLPDPFQAGGDINPDINLGADAAPLAAPVLDDCSLVDGDALDNLPGVGVGPGGVNTVDTNNQCDWPYIRLFALEELDEVQIRAGSASVTLIFDDFADSISSTIDRAAAYPVGAEVILQFTDFMFNINPVEEDAIFFVLDPATGLPTAILWTAHPRFDPSFQFAGGLPTGAGDGLNFPDIFPIFADLEFDERQVVELDIEGVNSLAFIFALDASAAAAPACAPLCDETIVTFAAQPFTFTRAGAATTADAAPGTAIFGDFVGGAPPSPGVDGLLNDVVAGGIAAGDQIAVKMEESDPNTSIYESLDEASGNRATVFTAFNDLVANFEFFDIVNSVAMTQHDGFTSVDAEVYDSADRSLLTVTDPDQNLRSRVSEEPDGRISKSFIAVGDPIPLLTSGIIGAGGNFFQELAPNVYRIWEAVATPAGTAGFVPDPTIFGEDIVAVDHDGFAVRADVGARAAAAQDGTIDDEGGAAVGSGTETFHARADLNLGPDGLPATGDEPAACPVGDFAEDIELVFDLDGDGCFNTAVEGEADADGDGLSNEENAFGTFLTEQSDFVAIRWTNAGTIDADLPSAIIVDTMIPLSDIDDLATTRAMTAGEVLAQVRLDNLDDGTVGPPGAGPAGTDVQDQLENFLVNIGRIAVDADGDGVIDPGEAIIGRGPGGVVNDLTLLPAATALAVEIPRYNLIHLDVTRVGFETVPAQIVVQIQVVHDSCGFDDDADGSGFSADAGFLDGVAPAVPTGYALPGPAFEQPTAAGPDGLVGGIDAGQGCVVGTTGTASLAAGLPFPTGATQIVDFSPFEATDTDGSRTSGDEWRTIVDPFGAAPAVAPFGGLVPTASEVSYDRDPIVGDRIGIGSFRVLDLVDVVAGPDVTIGTADDLADPADTFLRFVILFLDALVPAEPLETVEDDFNGEPHTMLLDIMGLSILFDPPSCGSGAVAAPATDFACVDPAGAAGGPNANIMDRPGTFSNVIYRIELDEEGSNSSIFTGRADFFTTNQFDTIQDVLREAVITGDPVRAWEPNRFIPPNRESFTYLDEDIVNVFRETAASFIYETRDGNVEFDRSSYSFGQDAFITLTDEDLNRRPDATERYNIPVDGFLFFELGVQLVPGIGALTANDFTVDATALETGPDTGTFVAQVTMGRSLLTVSGPDEIGGTADDGALVPTQQEDLEINYIDARDSSSITFATFTSIANIRTTLGDVVLDRAAYPPGALIFIEIHDNDFNTDVDIRERLVLTQLVAEEAVTIGGVAFAEGTTFSTGAGVGATIATPALCLAPAADLSTLIVGAVCDDLKPIVEVNIFATAGGLLLTMLPVGLVPDFTAAGQTTAFLIAGGAAAPGVIGRYGVGDPGTGLTVLPFLDRDGNVVNFAEETGPNTGIFEFEVRLPGPAFDPITFPLVLPGVLTLGTVTVPTIDANQPIQVTFLDPSDEAGDAEDEEELATILFNTARLRSDKIEYSLGDVVAIQIEEPDFNFDSRSIDEIVTTVLDIITDKFDTEGDEGAGVNPTNFGTAVAAAGISLDLPRFRETDFNSGVFQIMIDELLETLVDRGEDVELLFFDRTPSGGGSEIRVEYEFFVVEILPEIIFDKEEYTPFDEFIVSVISPDSNQDPDRIETIDVLISSSSASLGRTDLTETGPSTGIFEDDFDLTPDPARFPGNLRAIREDGVTVEFRIDEDTVATKSVFVNFHVGQVMFDKDAFKLNERGVLRVIDPDANRNPDTIDTTEVRFWSTTDRGGLRIVLRETGDRTGIYEEIISFTPDEESTGTRLRVAEGDTITAKYTDDTLPAPAALRDDEIGTVEVEELFASALIGTIIPALERAVAGELEIVGPTGELIVDVTVGSQVLIQSEITNAQTKKQKFAFIVQIKNDAEETVSLSWVTGELPAKDVLRAAQSWIPDRSGTYTIEAFVWESVDNPSALSPVRTALANVA